MNDFTDRMFVFMNYCGLSQNEFEIKCGVAHTNLREKKQGPTAVYIMKIITAFPDLNLNWLFRGEDGGPMLLSSANTENTYSININNWGELVNQLKDIIKQ